MAYERREFKGGATATSLSSGINSSVEAFSIADATNWPTGLTGDFFVVIDRGTASEEKVRCQSRATLAITVRSGGRGADGTTAVIHSAGASVEPCVTALDLDEANAHLSNQQADPHPMYTTAAELATALTAYLNVTGANALYAARAAFPISIGLALSDEATAITTGTAKLTVRAPFAFTLTGVRASLTTASTSGLPTVDINKNGTTVLSTKLTIDANEKTSVTAAAAPVISSASFASDDEITFDIDVAGTGAKGLKVWLQGTRVV